jgi:NAD(P)-dependent dehydrogenase (short-subunit alcohol dehydrogenase family)
VLQAQLHKDGMQFETDGSPKILTKFMANYIQSKVGVAWLTGLFADRLAEKGVLSVCVHPGLMPTPLQRHQPWFLNNVVRPLLVCSIPLCVLTGQIRVVIANTSYRLPFTSLRSMAHIQFFMPHFLMNLQWRITAAIAWLGGGNVICLKPSNWQGSVWRKEAAARRRSSWTIVTSS